MTPIDGIQYGGQQECGSIKDIKAVSWDIKQFSALVMN
jgi:hypothetical protein